MICGVEDDDMLEPKYIVYFDEVHEIEDIIIFSGFQKHCEVAHSLHGKVVSAGFVEIKTVADVTLIRCYGESDSLKVQARPVEDTALAGERLQLAK